MRLLAAAGFVVLLSLSSSHAQQPANPQAPSDKASYLSAADLDAAIAIPNGRKNGTNFQGKSIEGGTRQTLNKGDWCWC